ncbi:MAG TPA: matrixin family metalloprotease [Blastocatellia bacterium]|nr:matrixin family metalloprotease [Blastocatellia bacterium]
MKYRVLFNIARAFILSLIITFATASFSPAANPGKSTRPAHKRVITVSLLSDQAAPVPKALILDLISAASAEYQDMVNIELKVIEFIPYPGDLTLHPMDQAFLLSRLETRGEIRIIFSNRSGRNENQIAADSEEKNTLAGASHPYFGHVIIYDVEGRTTKTDRAGNPALLTVIKHEIAHLFGVSHSSDPDSFMSTPSSLSHGRWTDETIQQILKQRRKRWFPNK